MSVQHATWNKEIPKSALQVAVRRADLSNDFAENTQTTTDWSGSYAETPSNIFLRKLS